MTSPSAPRASPGVPRRVRYLGPPPPRAGSGAADRPGQRGGAVPATLHGSSALSHSAAPPPCAPGLRGPPDAGRPSRLPYINQPFASLRPRAPESSRFLVDLSVVRLLFPSKMTNAACPSPRTSWQVEWRRPSPEPRSASIERVKLLLQVCLGIKGPDQGSGGGAAREAVVRGLGEPASRSAQGSGSVGAGVATVGPKKADLREVF